MRHLFVPCAQYCYIPCVSEFSKHEERDDEAERVEVPRRGGFEGGVGFESGGGVAVAGAAARRFFPARACAWSKTETVEAGATAATAATAAVRWSCTFLPRRPAARGRHREPILLSVMWTGPSTLRPRASPNCCSLRASRGDLLSALDSLTPPRSLSARRTGN